MYGISLSLILPCYNVEKYITRCLDSIYSQDISETDYEVICVNDCSPDATRDIIIKYQKRHSNLVLIEHKINRKQGAARNTGLKAAKGNYIWFIDPDDYIENNCFRRLISITNTNNLEILQFAGYTVDTLGGNHKIFSYNNKTSIIVNNISGLEYIDTYGIWNIPVQPWIRLYKRLYLINNNLFFPEIPFGEDDYHTLQSIITTKSFSSIDDKLYYYRFNPNSTMHSEDYTADKLFTKSLTLGNLLICLGEELEITNAKLCKSLKEGGAYRINSIIKPIIKMPLNEKKLFFKMVDYQQEIITNIKPYLNKKIKVMLKYRSILYLINPFVQLVLRYKKRLS
jgi:glycosyltransferase involved in cell wall biosynthesis